MSGPTLLEFRYSLHDLLVQKVVPNALRECVLTEAIIFARKMRIRVKAGIAELNEQRSFARFRVIHALFAYALELQKHVAAPVPLRRCPISITSMLLRKRPNQAQHLILRRIAETEQQQQDAV